MTTNGVLCFLLFIILSNLNAFQKPTNYISVSKNLYRITMNTGNDPSPQKPKSTKFERTLNDFIGKRYGAGESFYGKAQAKLSEEEYSKTKSGQKRVYDPNAPMRDEAILLVGGLDEINQWVAFELNEKGFNVRVACSQLKQATNIFGFPGFNADIVELQGDASSEEKYAKCINGVQAIVIAVNFSPGLEKSKYEQEFITAKNIIDIAIKAQNAKVGEVKKIVLVSRMLPEILKGEPDVLTTIIQKRVDSNVYQELQSYHERLESYLRKSKFEYAIVRAPAIIKVIRPPAQFPLTLVAAQNPLVLKTQKSNNNKPNNFKKAPFPLSLISEIVDTPSIGVLDLAEVVSQSLLQDVSGMTFTVFETESAKESSASVFIAPKPEIIAGQKELEKSRVLRKVSFIFHY